PHVFGSDHVLAGLTAADIGMDRTRRHSPPRRLFVIVFLNQGCDFAGKQFLRGRSQNVAVGCGRTCGNCIVLGHATSFTNGRAYFIAAMASSTWSTIFSGNVGMSASSFGKASALESRGIR